MDQSDKEYRINEKTNKERFLHYFPADMKYLAMVNEEEKKDKKTCIYCGSDHVRQYDQELCGVCEDCRAEFLDDKQEFENIFRQTQKNLKQLMEIPIDLNMGVIYRRNWFRKSKKEKDDFGKGFVEVRKDEKTIMFIVQGMLPRSMFMYLISGYMIGIFLKQKIPQLPKSDAYRPIKYAMMKWGALHYMYLNGYTNFCRWKNLEETKDVEYKELTEKIGVPLENNRKDISEMISMLKEEIAKLEGKEGQENPV